MLKNKETQLEHFIKVFASLKSKYLVNITMDSTKFAGFIMNF